MNAHDYNRFMTLLYLCNDTNPVNIEAEIRKGRSFTELMNTKRDKPLIDIAAYCLMPNHFHILIKELDRNTAVFMKNY